MKQQNIFASFRNAFNGFCYFVAKGGRNSKIQLTSAAIAICVALYYHITVSEWVAILLCIGSVLCLEMLNCALEKLCDLVEPSYNPVIKIVKDVAAGAVLLASAISVIIALFIFLPKIFVL